jgi:NIPSNAP
MDAESVLLEVRLFRLRPGTRSEFDRISREGTVPLMRRLGIAVVAHGPSLAYEDVYYLIRAFSSAQERVELAQSLYAVPEWEEYDEPVTSMIADYSTAVLEVPRQALEPLAGRP